MYEKPLKTTAISSHPSIIGWLQQIGWMNAVLGVLCLLAAGLGFWGATQQVSSERASTGLAFCVSAIFYGWLWISFSVVAYGLAHVCLKLHELKIWMDAQK